MRTHSRRRLTLVALAAAVALAAVSTVVAMLGFGRPAASAAAGDRLAEAWDQAQSAGSYRFASDVEQTTTPSASILNAGRTSRVEQVHLEGLADVDESEMEFRVWSGGGSVLGESESLAVRVEDGKAYQQLGTGEWRQTGDFSQLIAPEGDFMSYLVAARDITELGVETRGAVSTTRYGFDLDGPTLAASMTRHLEEAMRQRGELPAGAKLQPPLYYAQMIGAGELWVDEAGYPLRQILSLQFPEQDGEIVSAEIRVDFSDFGALGSTAAGGWWSRGWDLLPGDPEPYATFWFLALAAGVGALAALLVRRRLGWAPLRTITVVIVIGLLAGPLAQPALSAQNRSELSERFDAMTEQSDREQAAAELARSMEAGRESLLSDPHRSRLSSMDRSLVAPSVLGGSSAGFVVAEPAPDAQFLLEDGNDGDGDGLTDFVEERIGTNWSEADTDGDGLDDGVEVNGFELGGNWWYPDPEAVDSNGDGISDSTELDVTGDGIPDDTDGDGVPDIFDSDNDGDGVPDHKDLAPFFVSREGGELRVFDEAPLLLTLDGGSSGPTPTFVEFQIRPLEQQQLQFALSPLDWPNDDEGQIRDVDGSVNDMKLVPMLEVIASSRSDFPAQEELQPHAITVAHPLADGSDAAAAYVPLNLVTDEKTGTRVAFSGRMLYSSAAAVVDHEIRLVWAVQVTNDVVCEYDPGVDDGCTPEGYAYNRPQIVHRYYEPWNLTALKVSEEHGSQVALLYEDPVVDADPLDDGPSWILSEVLGQRFLTSRQVGAVESYEITMDNIDSLIDRGSVPGAEGIYGLPNVFSVEKRSYPTLDEGVIATSTDVAPTLLDSDFGQAWTNDSSIMPLFLITYESRVRSLSADAAAAGAAGVVQSSNRLTLDFSPAGVDPVPVDRVIGMKWSYYCGGSSSAPLWQACEADTVWIELEERYGATQLDPDDLTQEASEPLDPDGASGQNIVMQLYALAMMQGLHSVSESVYSPSDVRVISGQFASPDDTSVENGVRTAARTARFAVKFVANQHFYNQLQGTYPIVKQLGQLNPVERNAGAAKAALGKLSLTGKTAVGIGMIAVVGAFATLAVLAATGNVAADVTLKVLAVSITTITGVAVPLYTLISISKAPAFAGAVSGQLLSLRSEAVGVTSKAAAIGAVIAIGITWGFFIYGIVSDGVTAFSPEFNRAFAGAIAATIFIVLLAVLSLTVVGLIIVGVIAVIDGILTLICELGVDELRSDFTDGGCFTLSASAIKFITALIYAYDLMIDAERDDLLEVGQPTIGLRDPAVGYIEGNGLDVSLPITTKIVHKDPSPESWQITAYLWFFSESNLRSTTFDYSLTSPEPAGLSVERDEMPGSWTDLEVDHEYLSKDMYRASYEEAVEVAIDFDDAGVNEEFEFHLNMAYAMPAFECWTVPQPLVPPYVAPICYKRTFDGDSTNTFDPIVYDVLPATLSEFIQLGERSSGQFGLGWDDAFAALSDADKDGALAGSFGGLDPNDEIPDSDFDGLTDAFELERRQEGLAVSPLLWDTDGDGLTDAQELEIGSDPGVADTDNDGLTDAEEVRHLVYGVGASGFPEWTGAVAGGWTVQVGSSTVVVSSDPLRPDADGDGISDAAERALAQAAEPADRIDEENRPYHPNVYNTPPIAIFMSVDDADGYVSPGQALTLTSVVEAKVPVEPSVLDVTVSDPRLEFGPYLLGFDPDTFDQVQTITQQTSLTASAPSVGSDLVLTSEVRARLEGGAASPPSLRVIPETSLQGVSTKSALYGDVDLATRLADRPDDYMLAETSSTSSATGGGGDVRNITLPGGTTRSLESDTEPVGPGRTDYRYLRGDQGASVACNSAGTCFTVWEHYDNCNTVTVNYLRVVDAQESGSSGIEPGVYIRREDTGGTLYDDLSLLWFSQNNGGNQMQDGDQRGPNANGFPVNATYCGDAALSVIEVDGSSSLDDTASKEVLWVHSPRTQTYEFDETTVRSGSTVRFENSDYHGNEDRTIGWCHTAVYPNTYCNRVDVNITIPDKSRERVAGAIRSSTGASVMPQFDLGFLSGPGLGDTSPAVATDGAGFRVAWSRIQNGSHQVMTRYFHPTGLAAGQEALVATLPSEASQIDVTWEGDGFRITWVEIGGLTIDPTTALPSLSLSIKSRKGSAAVRTHATFDVGLFSYLGASPHDIFDVEYDPAGGCTALVYSVPGGSTWGRTIDCSAATVIRELYGSVWGRLSPHLAFNPMTGGWVLTTQTATGALHVDLLGQLLSGTPGTSTTATSTLVSSSSIADSSVACPSPSALPVADLRFEELPGQLEFVDSSGYANNATAVLATSPDAGARGAPGAENSDFAIRFDGGSDQVTMPNPVGNQLSLAFWYKAPPAGGGQPFSISSGAGGYQVAIDNQTGAVSWSSGASSISAVVPGVNDGDWHFVAVSRAASGALTLRVDGSQRAASTSSEAPSTSATLTMSGGGSEVTIDHLRIYGVALTAATVESLRLRTQEPFCVTAGATNNSRAYPWARLFFDEDDGRGGRLGRVAELRLAVDSAAPTSSVAAIPSLQPATVLVGGSAIDDLSGVSEVEVRVRSVGGQWGSWQSASGTESWTFQIVASSGDYEIQSRATDAVGNVETPGAPVTLSVDSTAPTVALDALPASPVRPGSDPVTGQPAFSVAGTVSDSGSGVSVDGVEVQLVPQGALPDVDRWQTATNQSGLWSAIYPFSATSGDVSGTYTVLVRATDAAGNRTSDDAASGALVIDANAPEIELSLEDAARRTITDAHTLTGQVSDPDGAGITAVEVALTPLSTVAGTGSAASWVPVSLSESGPGVLNADWSFPVPTGVEDFYQVDLRTTDAAGNAATTSNVWRGIIDTLAPRLTFEIEPTGNVHTNGRRFEFNYRCLAEDLFLSAEEFDCPGKELATPVRSFNTDPVIQEFFPDQTVLTSLESVYAKWENTDTPDVSLTACDLFGSCSTVTSAAVPVPAAFSALAGPLNGAVVSPTRGQHVAATDEVEVVVAADASDGLLVARVEVWLGDPDAPGNNPAAVVDHTNNPKATVQEILTVAVSAGDNVVSVRVVADDGSEVWSDEVEFFVDTAPPTLTLGTTTLDGSSSWGPGSDVLRFRGTVADDGTIAAVQIKVGDYAWADAIFNSTTWRTAIRVPDSDGTTLAVAVRAFDLAGRVTEISDGQVEVELAPQNYARPDTSITSGPASSTPGPYIFEFEGHDGDGVATGFVCRVDDQPQQVCASPWPVDGLSAGSHTFAVAAVDELGYQDLSPAEWDWIVPVEGPQVTLTRAPADPSPDGNAEFIFDYQGQGLDPSFECSVDSGPFTPCSSPVQLTGLSGGGHLFEVRVTAGGVTGSPSSHRWTVVNDPPVVFDAVLTTVENNRDGEPLRLELAAIDTDDLTYVIVDRPDHGFVEGDAQQGWRYVPLADYYGPDSFSFYADDGQSRSEVATVHITVRMEDFVVYADESASLGNAVVVHRDGVGVNIADSGSYLSHKTELSLGEGVEFLDPSSLVAADSIIVKNKAVLQDVAYNEIDNKGTVLGVEITPLTNPYQPLPAMPGDVSSGGADQAVGALGLTTLDQGSYGALRVGKGATIVLSGGLYRFDSIDVETGGRILFDAPAEIRVTGHVHVGSDSEIGPSVAAVGLDGGDLVIYVAGVNSKRGGPKDGPTAVDIGPGSVVHAYVLAPSGTITLGKDVLASGGFLGRWVDVGNEVELNPAQVAAVVAQ